MNLHRIDLGSNWQIAAHLVFPDRQSGWVRWLSMRSDECRPSSVSVSTFSSSSHAKWWLHTFWKDEIAVQQVASDLVGLPTFIVIWQHLPLYN